MSTVRYSPRIKGRAFCPNPIGKEGGGIPLFADSETNPNVVNTPAWRDWWMEQFDYCKYGYRTGGVTIPGRYYYYLNFCYLSTTGRGYHHPDYVDYDLEYAELVEEAKKIHWGIIGLKRRRAGFSEKWVNMIASYGLRFGSAAKYLPHGYSAGIVAGLSTYSEELGKKLGNTNHLMAPELNLHIPKGGDDWEVYYTELLSNGKSKKSGTLAKIKIRTANTNPGVLKGEHFNDVAFEESGEFELLDETLADTEPCFKVGDLMIGTPYIYGTGGNISKGSKAFREMWFNAKTLKLFKTEAFLGRLRNKYYIGSVNAHGEIEYNCPNIIRLMEEQNLSIEQVLGCEDIQEAEREKDILRADYLKAGKRVQYYKDLQNDPKNEKEAFLKFNANPYPLEILTIRESEILALSSQRTMLFKPSWKLDNNGNIKIPLEVDLEPVDLDDLGAFDEYVKIHVDHVVPKKNRDLYYGGVDGYDIDTSETSDSLGGMVIGTRINNIPNARNKQIVAAIYCRPTRKEKFYEMCAMMSVHFKLIGSTMMDARSPGIIEWYKRNGFTRYLAKRPQSVESEFSEQIHDYGYKQTTFSKPVAIGKVQSWCEDEAAYCDFIELLKDIRDVDIENMGTDWDLHDALQNMLIGIDDKPKMIARSESVENEYDPFAISTSSGQSMPVSAFINPENRSTKKSGQVYDPFDSF